MQGGGHCTRGHGASYPQEPGPVSLCASPPRALSDLRSTSCLWVRPSQPFCLWGALVSVASVAGPLHTQAGSRFGGKPFAEEHQDGDSQHHPRHQPSQGRGGPAGTQLCVA